MICLYQRPDKSMIKVVTGPNMKRREAAQKLNFNDILWGKRVGDLAEGVYDDNGEFLGSFYDYWHYGHPEKS